jgi:hypothetical protein
MPFPSLCELVTNKIIPTAHTIIIIKPKIANNKFILSSKYLKCGEKANLMQLFINEKQQAINTNDPIKYISK